MATDLANVALVALAAAHASLHASLATAGIASLSSCLELALAGDLRLGDISFTHCVREGR